MPHVSDTRFALRSLKLAFPSLLNLRSWRGEPSSVWPTSKPYFALLGPRWVCTLVGQHLPKVRQAVLYTNSTSGPRLGGWSCIKSNPTHRTSTLFTSISPRHRICWEPTYMCRWKFLRTTLAKSTPNHKKSRYVRQLVL